MTAPFGDHELKLAYEPVVDLLETVGVWWQVMADPEGNELCVVAEPGHPGPQEWSGR